MMIAISINQPPLFLILLCFYPATSSSNLAFNPGIVTGINFDCQFLNYV
jgi:hypothetical protein